jgi:curved DNA-binding protein CbpA
MDLNYYEVLGVPQYATTEQIEQAYRKVSKIYHPDAREGISNPALFAAATQSRDTLINLEERIKYDAQLARPTSDPPPAPKPPRPEPPYSGARAYTGPTPPPSKKRYAEPDPKPKKRLKSPSLLLVALGLFVLNSLESHVDGASAINAVLENFIWIALIGAFTVPKKWTRRFFAFIRHIVYKGWTRQLSKASAGK